MKRILVACGNGVATSTVVAMKIKEKLEEEGINAHIDKAKLLEVPSKQGDYDLIVSTGKYDSKDVTVPVISGMSFLTGIGVEDTMNEIIDFIK